MKATMQVKDNGSNWGYMTLTLNPDLDPDPERTVPSTNDVRPDVTNPKTRSVSPDKLCKTIAHAALMTEAIVTFKLAAASWS